MYPFQQIIEFHMIALALAFCLDLAFGDPYWMPHPVKLVGKIISRFEKANNSEAASAKERQKQGKKLVLLLVTGTLLVTGGILFGAYVLHPVLGVCVEGFMTYQTLAMNCLRKESMKVYSGLLKPDVEAARKAVSMIVGRDTEDLDEAGIAKAAVETVAENASDGVIAPLFYSAIGGPVFGMTYKTINTMDSMIAYKNDRYLDFGRCAAKLDDLVNFLPARISAFLLILAAYILPKDYSGKNAFRIFKRDRLNHASPNSAQTESAVAGALGLQLAGNASYFGKVLEKPTIGDALRDIEPEDIRRANTLMYTASYLMLFLIMLILRLLQVF